MNKDNKMMLDNRKNKKRQLNRDKIRQEGKTKRETIKVGCKMPQQIIKGENGISRTTY